MSGMVMESGAAQSVLSRAVPALGLGVVLLGLLFHAEIAAAVQVWTESTAYNHCWLVLLIAVWLGWERRASLRGMPLRPAPWAALLALPVGLAWLAAERLGIMEGRQLTALTLVELLVVAVIGWRMAWALCGPLLYLYFLVPFGAFLVPRLQDVTAASVRWGLSILGVPAYVDGWLIEIPEGVFFIAEACAGLRFLIAAIAFGCLYALLMYRSPWRRGAFILASILVPILANGLRALGIVWLGHVLGSAQAAAADHVLYGWLFFSAVILLLILLGLPFRQDDAPHAVACANPAEIVSGRAAPPATPTLCLAAALFAACLAAFGPALAAGLDRMARAEAPPAQPLALGAGCVTMEVVPLTLPAGNGVRQRATCQGLPLDIRVVVFSPRSTAGPVLAERRRLDAADAEQEAIRTQIPGAGDPPPVWQLTDVPNPPAAGASALWVDGRPATGGFGMRVRMAWASLVGGTAAPVAIGVTPVVDWAALDLSARRGVAARLEQLLATDPAFAAGAERLARGS